MGLYHVGPEGDPLFFTDKSVRLMEQPTSLRGPTEWAIARWHAKPNGPYPGYWTQEPPCAKNERDARTLAEASGFDVVGVVRWRWEPHDVEALMDRPVPDGEG